ncbi:MAG: fumarylacetoacetate hydrolase family protein [Alphaproteobacteria bacterium]
MRRARIAYRGGTYEAMPAEHGALLLADGRKLYEEDVVFLPPVVPRTSFALALNYAAHQKELGFKPPDKPLVFLKGPNTFIGHLGETPRPRSVKLMHFECELVVIIGRSGKNISREEAMNHVGGYTVANDYVARDLIENYYRPNLVAKNRDRSTAIGPWYVDASDIPHPHNLSISTFVNGERVQHGSTRDMIFDIPHLISYLSEYMTLSPGDMILTGTPEGASNVMPGDEVVTEIESVGRLVNKIVADDR